MLFTFNFPFNKADVVQCESRSLDFASALKRPVLMALP